MNRGLTEYFQFILKNKFEEYINSSDGLGNSELTEQHFFHLSQAIRKRFNKELSVSTIKRILRNRDYDFTRTDKRVSENLNLLVKLLKYKSWDSFKNANIGHIKTSLRNVTIDKSEIPSIALTIERALRAEFEAMKNLPNVDISEVENYYMDNDSAVTAFLSFLELKQNQSAYLFTPSSFYEKKIAKVTFVFINVVFVSVKIRGYYLWKHCSSHTDIEITDIKTTKIFCLHKTQGSWFICNELDYYLENEGIRIYEKSLTE